MLFVSIYIDRQLFKLVFGIYLKNILKKVEKSHC